MTLTSRRLSISFPFAFLLSVTFFIFSHSAAQILFYKDGYSLLRFLNSPVQRVQSVSLPVPCVMQSCIPERCYKNTCIWCSHFRHSFSESLLCPRSMSFLSVWKKAQVVQPYCYCVNALKHSESIVGVQRLSSLPLRDGSKKKLD